MKEVFLAVLSVVWCITPRLKAVLEVDLKRAKKPVQEALDSVWQLVGRPRSSTADVDASVSKNTLQKELYQVDGKVPARYDAQEL
jgi:hypothetical protein